MRHRSSSTCTGARAGFSPPAPPPCTSSERTGLAQAPAMSKHCPCCWITWSRCPGGLSSASPTAAASTTCRAAGDTLSCVEADWHQDPARALHCIYYSFPGFRNPLGPYLKGHWWGAHAFCPFCPSTSPVHLAVCPSGPLILLPWLHLAHTPRPHQSARLTLPGLDPLSKQDIQVIEWSLEGLQMRLVLLHQGPQAEAGEGPGLYHHIQGLGVPPGKGHHKQWREEL